MTLIINADCFDGEKFLRGAAVLIEGEKIAGVYDAPNGPSLPDGAAVETVDAGGRLLAPGYIDIHLHGCAGCDTMDGDPASIEKMARFLAENGTTSFLPTTLTTPPAEIRRAVEAAALCMGKSAGANVLGAHLEGPFVNARRKGSQNEKYILPPSVPVLLDLTGENFSAVKRLTLAPELPGAAELIRYAAEKGVCVSAGHTCASAAVFEEGVAAGVTLCTHLFNGMEPLHHREPGTVGEALLDDRVYVEFIADLLHLHRDILKLIVRLKGDDRCVLITDALAPTGLGDGEFAMGGQRMTVKNQVARIENGALAGSLITMQDAVKNMVRAAGVPLGSVLKMAALNPARALGLDHRKGRIKAGFDADLNLLDGNFDVAATMVMGRRIR